MVQLQAIKVLSRHLCHHLARHVEKILFLFLGTLFHTYGLNLSQIGS